MWFDSHCHLHICEEREPVEEVVERARLASVDGILTAATDVKSSRRCVELANGEQIFAAVGIHPNDATGFDEDAASEIEGLAGLPEVAAIGESGLDFYRDYAPAEDQERAFAFHIDLAKRTSKALIIHTRDSIDRAIAMLEREGPPPRFVFHCWSAEEDRLRAALELGAHVSFAGNVTFKSASDLRTAAALVPSDRLLIETDSPYLAPVPQRGRPNEPSYVAHVGAGVAAARSASVEELAATTTRNARALFGS